MADIRTLTPAWEMKVDKIDRINRLVEEAVVSVACKQLGHYKDHFVVRQLLPEDVGLGWWTVPFQRKNTSTLWIDTIIGDMKFVAIQKVILFGRNPKVSRMKVEVKRFTKGIYSLDQLYSVLPVIEGTRLQNKEWIEDTFGSLYNIRMEAYFPSPYLISQKEWLRIEVESMEDSSGDKMMLGGVICEPLGMKIA